MKRHFLFFILAISVLGFSYTVATAASYVTFVSDLLSTSAPATSTDQTITFTLNQSVPANGVIELYFDEGGFMIPVALDFSDIDLGFSAVSGGPYTQRPLSVVQTAGTDDVTVTSGTAGNIRFDLNTSVGIPAGNQVQVTIGTNSSYGSVGDQQMLLSAATGSYPVTIYTYDAADVELDYGRTMIAINDLVTIGPVDTTDVVAPVILSSSPSGILQVGTRGVELFVETDENAECRYATSSMAFASMPYFFYGTTTGLVKWHFAQETGLTDDTTYTYFVRCVDFRLNEIDPDYELTFVIGVLPGSATTTSTTTGGGTGTGTGSSTASSTGTGTGTGSSGSGSGSSSGDGAGSGSGGSGGSYGSGSNLPQADVRVEGWAYPGSSVTFLRDGVAITDKTAGTDASFSNLTEGLDRGSYTFGVYAVDKNGTRGATYTTTLWLRSSTLNVLANIMLPPTFMVTSDSVQPGSPVEVTGYTVPNGIVTTWLRPMLAEVSSSDIVATTSASASGVWSQTIPTTGLSIGTYELVAQASMPDGLVESDKSVRMSIGVGVEVENNTDCGSNGDQNCDGSINLVDFSILLFNWNTSSDVADINADGIVSLPDFSIMLFNWTG